MIKWWLVPTVFLSWGAVPSITALTVAMFVQGLRGSCRRFSCKAWSLCSLGAAPKVPRAPRVLELRRTARTQSPGTFAEPRGNTTAPNKMPAVLIMKAADLAYMMLMVAVPCHAMPCHAMPMTSMIARRLVLA